MQDRGYELPRILLLLLGNKVNKGKRKGRACWYQWLSGLPCALLSNMPHVTVVFCKERLTSEELENALEDAPKDALPPGAL
jgi:hypothetical protein